MIEGKYAIWMVAVALTAVALYSYAGSSITSNAIAQDMPVKPGVVRITEYSDFKCPYCGRAAENVGVLKEKYGDKIEVLYKHFPLSFHQGADTAAEASECARDQGRFWEYHDRLFEDSGRGVDIGRATTLKTIAGELDLDTDAFNECLDSGAKKSLVKQQINEASRLGVTGTPTFFIEGEKIVGAQPVETFSRIIDSKIGG
ncbi:MAG: thioredoxin domain-containing protein [Candidatus Altiarchaeota archaeon]